MKISARNLLKGTIESVNKGYTPAHVVLDVGGATVAGQTSAATRTALKSFWDTYRTIFSRNSRTC